MAGFKARPVKSYAVSWRRESERHEHEWRPMQLHGAKISVCDCGAVRDMIRRPIEA